MESAAEAPGAMAAGEATCDPSLSSSAPPSPPPPPPAPPPSTASTKRRWSPCTWRYAIEDAQAELPSRQRASASLGASAPPPSSRAPHSSLSQQQLNKSAKPPCYNPLYGKAADEPQRISSCPPRLQVVGETTRVQSSASQPPAHSKSRTRELHRKSHHRYLHSSRARPCEEDEEEDDGEAEQDLDDYDDHQGLAVYDEEYFKVRRREMSPSELYFCAMCSTKAVESREACPYDDA